MRNFASSQSLSELKKMAFQKEREIATEYFYNHYLENRGFTHNVLSDEICYFIEFKKDDKTDLKKTNAHF